MSKKLMKFDSIPATSSSLQVSQVSKELVEGVLEKTVNNQRNEDRFEANEGNGIETEVTIFPKEILGKSETIGSKESINTEDVNLGIIQKILNICLDKSDAICLTIILLMLFRCGDSGSDLGLVYYLINANFTTEAYLVLATDYLPVFLTLIHFFMSSKKRRMSLGQQAILAAVFIILNPFMPAICNFLWLVCRTSGRQNHGYFYHYLAKLTSGIHGTFEERIFLSDSKSFLKLIKI